jgi:hypothetical protein
MASTGHGCGYGDLLQVVLPRRPFDPEEAGRQ